MTFAFRRAALAVLVALAALALSASTARAEPVLPDLLVPTEEECEAQVLDRSFLRWADLAHYTLAPGGALESRPRDWTLTGDAQIVPGNEPFHVRDPDDQRSLLLPPGSAAVTATVCVGLEHPTLRFFARPVDAPLIGMLAVEVLFQDVEGVTRALPIGLVEAVGEGEWAPTTPLPVVANLLPLLPGRRTAVAFRFTPTFGSTWQIDDVYVDPWKMR